MISDRILHHSGRIIANRGNGAAVLGYAFRAHVGLYRLTGGMIGHRVPGMPPYLLLDHVGARSGVARTSPLGYMRDGANVVLVASNGGGPRNPAWLHNLRANPDTTIQIGRHRHTVRAHVADASERARLWPMFLELDDVFVSYQERTDREIPLVVLEPRMERN